MLLHLIEKKNGDSALRKKKKKEIVSQCSFMATIFAWWLAWIVLFIQNVGCEHSSTAYAHKYLISFRIMIIYNWIPFIFCLIAHLWVSLLVLMRNSFTYKFIYISPMGNINFIFQSRTFTLNWEISHLDVHLASYHVEGYLGEYSFSCIPLAFTFPINLFRDLLSMVEKK